MQFVRNLLIFTTLLGLALSNSMSAYWVNATMWRHPTTKQELIFFADRHNSNPRCEAGTEERQVNDVIDFLESKKDSLQIIVENSTAVTIDEKPTGETIGYDTLHHFHKKTHEKGFNVHNIEFRHYAGGNHSRDLKNTDQVLKEVRSSMCEYDVIKEYCDYFKITILDPYEKFITYLRRNSHPSFMAFYFSIDIPGRQELSDKSGLDANLIDMFKTYWLHYAKEEPGEMLWHDMARLWHCELLSIRILQYICKSNKNLCIATGYFHIDDLENHYQLGSLLKKLGFEKVVDVRYTQRDRRVLSLVDLENFFRRAEHGEKSAQQQLTVPPATSSATEAHSESPKTQLHTPSLNNKMLILSGLALGLLGFGIYKWFWSKK